MIHIDEHQFCLNFEVESPGCKGDESTPKPSEFDAGSASDKHLKDSMRGDELPQSPEGEGGEIRGP